MPVVCRYAGPRGSGQYCAPRHQAARRRRSSARRLATLPSMNSSPIRTDIPPTRSGSTITLRWISCPYAAARTAASRSRCSALSAMATRTTAIRRSRHCAASRAYSVRLASRLRPLGCTAAWLIRYRASGVALPSRSESSRPRLYSAGTSGLDRTVRSSGAPATTRPNRNSWSSRSSRWRPRSAAAEIDRTASCSAASDNSAGRDHCPAARLATRSMVASLTRPPSRSRTRPVLASTGRLPSASARRSAGSASSSVTTAKSSSPSVLAAAADVTAAESCSLASAREARLAPLMSGPRPRAGAAGLIFEILHEALHDAALSGLVLQRLTHDPAGQVYGQGAHLGPEHLDRQLAVGVDLRVRRGDQAPGLGLGLLPHLGDDLGALFLGLLAEPGGLLPGFRELLLVLLEPLIRLGLRLLGALDAALDLLGPLGQGLLDPREQHLVEDAENDQERDRADDQLGKARKQRTLRTRCGQVFHGLASSPVSITFSLTDRSARGVEDVRDDQADQRERLGQGEPDVHVGADQPGRFGLPGHGLHAVTEDEADTDAGPDSGEAIGDRAEVDVELRGGCGSSHEMCEKHVLIPLRSGRRIPGGGVAVTAVRLPASSAFLPRLRVMSVTCFQRTADVLRGQDREDESLQPLDEHLEGGEHDDHGERARAEQEPDAEAEHVPAREGEHQDQDVPGEHVAEQPDRQGKRPDQDVLEDLDRGQDEKDRYRRAGRDHVLEVAAQALMLDAHHRVGDVDHKHQRDRIGDPGCHRELCDGDDLHQVHHPDEEEQ